MSALARGRSAWIRWLRRGKIVVLLGIALVAYLIAGSAAFRGQHRVHQWEMQAHDARFVTRGPLPRHDDVVIVGINATSFDATLLRPYAHEHEALRLMAENPAWPWPRRIHAHVIERLLMAGARTVAVDIVFASERDDDAALIAVLDKYPGRVVLAATAQEMRGDNGATQTILQWPNTALLAAVGGEGGAGFVTYRDDGDSIRRRFDYRTSLVRENSTLRAFMEDPRDWWKFATLAASRFTRHSLDGTDDLPIPFSGPAKTYPSLPVEELFIEHIWQQDRRYAGGEAFRDKLVFYGPIAEILHDTMATPYGEMPGVEVHAQLAAALIQGNTLRDATVGENNIVAILCALLVISALLGLRSALWQSLSILAVAALYLGGSQWAFSYHRILFPTVPALFITIATGTLGMVYLFLLEQWERAQTRQVLNRFVSKRIAAVILRNAEEFENARRGEKRPVSVLFSDIRGFTTWSERVPAEHLVGQLNEYFEKMVPLIEDTEGNAQKFIGDAILAVWGDTHSHGQAEDTARAITAALQMRSALCELNALWAGREDRTAIQIGIGVNHGEVVVGEVGHPERREFTVLGDGVNFAARLESATKQFHLDCLIGEQAEALVRDRFHFRQVDYLRVKGKMRPVYVFTVLSDATHPPPAWLAPYHAARALYTRRHFREAAEAFRAVESSIHGGDYLCAMYAERCERYAIEPPPADWDGSYTLADK